MFIGKKCRVILLVIHENSFILMLSSITPTVSSLVLLCKSIKGTQTYGERQPSGTSLSRL